MSVESVPCAACGAPIERVRSRGRPRKYCLQCRPREAPLKEPQLALRLTVECEVEDCERPVQARGLCSSHYQKFYWRPRNPNYQREWHERNPGYQRDYCRRWRDDNPEAMQAIARRAYANNRTAIIARSVARKRGFRRVSRATIDYRDVLKRDPCAYCGAPMEHIEHIQAVALGGSNEWPNLTAACADCNYSKGTRGLLEFLCLRLTG